MPQFDYTASDRSGAISKGQIEAVDKASASRALASRGLFVLEVKKLAQAPAPPPPKPPPPAPSAPAVTGPARVEQSDRRPELLAPPWSRIQRALYLRQMEVMFGAGIPLHRVARVLSESKELQPATRQRLVTLSDDLERGRSLSRALERSKLFTRLIVSAIRLGEESGRLEAILRALASNEEQAVKLGRAILSRLTYPLVVMAVMCLGLVVLGHVMGRVMSALPALQSEAGPVIGALTTVFTHGAFLPALIVGLLVSGVLFRLAWRQEAIRFGVESRLLQLPVIGPLMARLEANIVAGHLALLVRSGLPLDRGLGLCAELVHTAAFQRALRECREELRAGNELSVCLRESQLFPEDVLALVSAGEVSGSLDRSLETAARYCSDQVERTLETALSVLEPLLIGVLGIAIGTVLLMTFVPIFNSLNSL